MTRRKHGYCLKQNYTPVITTVVICDTKQKKHVNVFGLDKQNVHQLAMRDSLFFTEFEDEIRRQLGVIFPQDMI